MFALPPFIVKQSEYDFKNHNWDYAMFINSNKWICSNP